MRMKIISWLLALAPLILGALGYDDDDFWEPRTTISPDGYRIALMGKNHPCAGTLWISHNKTFGPVCYRPSSQHLPISGKDLKQRGCGTTLKVFTEVLSSQTPMTFQDYDTTCAGVPGRVRCKDKLKETEDCKMSFEIRSSQFSSSDYITEVRLVGGNSHCDGTLEVYFKDTWWRVRGQLLDETVAEVACRDRWCGSLRHMWKVPSDNHQFLAAQCSGEEMALFRCLYYTENPFSSPSHDIGIVCTTRDHSFKTRLVGGESHCAGNVEVSVDNSWKKICSDYLSPELSAVVCKELGCGSFLDVVRGSDVWNTSGPGWDNHFSCKGYESQLSHCVHLSRRQNYCENPQDRLGITCSGFSSFQVRLVNGSHSCEGQVEVYYNGTWGNICEENWDMRDAAVVCRQTGCGPALEARREIDFSNISRPAWLDNVFCSGLEADLSLCASQRPSRNQCYTVRIAGVSCSSSGISNVRLVDGSNHCSGRLEVYYENAWGTVKNDDWDIEDATVVCKQLGCGSAIETDGNPFGPGSGPVWLKKVFCNGSESHLSQCGSLILEELDNDHMHDVGVTCSGADADISNVRLVDGSNRCNGRLEVYSNDTWKKAQSYLFHHAQWDLPDVVVLCKQLECGPVLEVSTKDHLQEERTYDSRKTEENNLHPPENVNVEYFPLDVLCSGTESSIAQCGSKRMIPQPNQHIYVECSDSGISGVRLVDGDNSCSGRIEVNINNTWGSVCNYRWDMNDAIVVCKELGCGSAVEATQDARFKPGSGPVWLKAVFCSGNETLFSQCGSVMSEHYPCDHRQVAGVICSGAKQERKSEEMNKDESSV